MLRALLHPFLFPALLSCLVSFPALAGDNDGLSGSIEAVPSQEAPPPPSTPFPVMPEEPAPADDGTDAAPPPAPVVTAPKPSPRFNLEERGRFRRWLTDLCRQDPVVSDDADRVRFARGKAPVTSSAKNKAGSLLLLLENYSELAQFRDACEAARKQDPDACVQQGRVPRPWEAKDPKGKDSWTAFGSNRFWLDIRQNRSPSGVVTRTDLLAASKERVRALELELSQNFFDFRDAAELNGHPGSGAKASQLVQAVRDESTCGTRAVGETSERYPASQK